MEKLRDKVILIISPQAWGLSFVSKHHYAQELARRGNTVFFLNPMSRVRIEGGARLTRISPRLSVVDYNEVFPGNRRWIGPLAVWSQRADIRRIRRVIGRPLDLVWSFDPFRLQFLGDWGAPLKIYHPVDFHSFWGERRVAGRADIILSCSHLILGKFSGWGKPLHFINHGLGRHFLSRGTRAAALPGRFKIKAGYVGNLLYPHLDWELLFRVVDENPAVGFYFIGPFEPGGNLKGNNNFEAQVQKLRTRKNTFFLGPKPSHQLPGYLRAMDLFLMSYTGKKNMERLANPHKILEYLSVGKPVVSHYIQEYADKRDLIHMAEDNDELPGLFRRVVAGLRAKGQGKIVRRRIAYAAQHSYLLQIRRIERILFGAKEK